MILQKSFYSLDRPGLIYLENEKYLTRLVVNFLSHTYNDRVNGLLIYMELHCTLFFPRNFYNITKNRLKVHFFTTEGHVVKVECIIVSSRILQQTNVTRKCLCDSNLMSTSSIYLCMYICFHALYCYCCNIDNFVYILNIEILL